MNKIIVIRADGNSNIGFGHIMRTQALAQQLEKMGAEVIFFTRNPENIFNYKTREISLSLNLKEEDNEVIKLFKEINPSIVIIDSYEYDQERLNRIAALNIITACIDDLNKYKFNVDFVVNGNLYAPQLNYQGQAQFLLGSKYLLLREEFKEAPHRVVKPEVKDILITFGAADINNITPKILRLVKKYKNFSKFNWNVVIGPVYKNIEELKDLVSGNFNITLHYNPEIKKLMEKCDICISGAGSTIYELAVCGIPSIIIVVADNQKKLAKAAQLHGIAQNIGWYSDLTQENLFNALDTLISDNCLRKKMSTRGQELIDGKGAERVARILLSAEKGEII